VCRRCGARIGTERFCVACGAPTDRPPRPGAGPAAPPEQVAEPAPAGRSGPRSTVFLALAAVLLLVLGAGVGFALSRVTGGPTVLVTPQLLGPSDGSAFTHYPRDLDLRWSPVAGAASYTVEVEFLNPSNSPAPDWRLEPGDGLRSGVMSTSVRHTFGGSQPGRWRVTAVGPDGTVGAASAWWGFTFEL
jgi:hypothetical protein